MKEGTDVFTIKDSLQLPRSGPVVVNPAGDLFLVSLAQAAWGERPSRWIHVSTTADPHQSVDIALTAPGETFWLDDHTIGYIRPGDDCMDLLAYKISKGQDGLASEDTPISIGSLPPGSGNFIYHPLAQTLAFSASVYEDFDLAKVAENDRKWNERGHTALVYDHANVRNIDVWRGPKRPSLFTVVLKKSEGEWKLGSSYNAPLKSVKHYAPSEPYGGTEEFDVSATSLVYAIKPDSFTPWQTKQKIFVVDLIGAEEPRELTSGDHGIVQQPQFNHGGDLVAWLQASVDGNETAKSVIVAYDLKNDVRTTISPEWEFSPDSFHFSSDDKLVYMTVPHLGRGKVFAHAFTLAEAAQHGQRELTSTGTASSLASLPDGRLLFMRSSYDLPNNVFLLKSDASSLLSGNIHESSVTDFYGKQLKDKHMRGGTDIWWTGGAQPERKVQGWVVTPPGFKKGEIGKYPAIMMIHGGPSAVWQDMWFPRYNLNTYANQGYIVFAPNGTGSTSFGQDFQDAIAGDWGGAPFTDMRAGWSALLEEYPEIDRSRTAAWGASWGGYGIAWLQSRPDFDFGFKAYVSVCGLFDTTWLGWTSDQGHLFTNGFGGFPWEKNALALSDKFSPSRYVENWSKPMLLVHGGNDFSVSVTQALGAFRALQQKSIASRFVVFPDENHYISNPGNILKFHEEIFSWLEEYTKAGSD